MTRSGDHVITNQVQSGLQAIAYLNFQLLPQPQPQSQWPHHLHHPRCICIIPIRLMILDVHQQRFLYIQSSQIQAYVLVRPGDHWSIHQEAFVILVNALMFIEDEADVRTREKS